MSEIPTASFLLDHLRRISRSFYVPIQGLRPPYREWIALAYLSLRILDTIEDSLWDSQDDQGRCFGEFEAFIGQPADDQTVRKWSCSFPSSLTPAERFLIEDTYLILRRLHALPARARGVLQRTTLTMSCGMKFFLAEKRRLTSISELDLYCFLVAGIVAELLVDLLAIARPSFVVDSDLVLGARHFGVALQKINILKDIDVDNSQGRWFICEQSEVERSLAWNVREALSFFARLPPEEWEFRLFCQLSLLLGLFSLGSGPSGSLPVPSTAGPEVPLPDRIRSISGDSEAIERLARELHPRLAEACQSSASYPDLTPAALESSAPKPLVRVLRTYFADSMNEREVQSGQRGKSPLS